jgi:hypothetical protein
MQQVPADVWGAFERRLDQGSGAGRPASGLPQVGARLLGLLHQKRPFPSLAHEPGLLPDQAGSQKPVGGPEEPGRRVVEGWRLRVEGQGTPSDSCASRSSIRLCFSAAS